MHSANKNRNDKPRRSITRGGRLVLLFAITFCVCFSFCVIFDATSATAQQGFTTTSNALKRLESVGPNSNSPRTSLPDSLRGFQDNRQTWQSFSTNDVARVSFNADVSSADVSNASEADVFSANSQTNREARSGMPDASLVSDDVSAVGNLNRSDANFSDLVTQQTEQLMTREGTGSSVKIAILLATLSLAPAIILMTTCYVRIVVVLTLLRQAFGSQQLPSTQILTALSLFVTFLVMAPTWNEIKTEAIDPYSTEEISWQEAWHRGLVPVKRFMCRQIEIAKNEDAVALFYEYLPEQSGDQPESIDEVPINVLLPAYLVSELKVAFLLGFQVYLPFLIVDLVVSSVTVSMGMVMLPPTMVSFPLKLILFVLVDGWNLVIAMLLQSFGPYT